MSKPDHYRQYALDCMRLANATRQPGAKAVLIDMAQSWLRLSEQAQRNRRLDLFEHASPERPAGPAALGR